jgi:hypoxanthine phosphoribosyltransferase
MFDKMSLALSKKIIVKNRPLKFDTLLCISRGGLVLGRVLSDILNLPLGVISAKSYDVGGFKAKKTSVEQEVSISGKVGKNMLLIDDLVDTGNTMLAVKKFLKKRYPLSSIKICVLYKDQKSLVLPDYFLKIKKDWIVFPYEKNEFKK